jgi:AraC-like DNA-binding protein
MPSDAVHSFPAAHGRDLIELAESRGVPRNKLFEQLTLTPDALSPPEARLSLRDMQQLVARVEELTEEPSLGLQLGLRMRVPVHGYLGFAIMTSPSLRDGLELVARFTPTRTTALAAQLVLEDHEACLFLDELTDLGPARETLITALGVSTWQISQTLTGVRLPARCDLAFAAKSGVRQLQVRELSMHYGQPRNCLRFPLHLLELPVSMAHAGGYELAREQCERELSELESAPLAARIRVAMWDHEAGLQGLEDISRKLGMSSSTLKRKLKQEGTAFSDVLDSGQRERACLLLRGPLSIEQVAERVGYGDVSNFGRAFKRWTGLTPAAYRKSNGSRE